MKENNQRNASLLRAPLLVGMMVIAFAIVPLAQAQDRTAELVQEGSEISVDAAGDGGSASLDSLTFTVGKAPCVDDPDWCGKCAQWAMDFCQDCAMRGFDCEIVDSVVHDRCSCSAWCLGCSETTERFRFSVI